MSTYKKSRVTNQLVPATSLSMVMPHAHIYSAQSMCKMVNFPSERFKSHMVKYNEYA